MPVGDYLDVRLSTHSKGITQMNTEARNSSTLPNFVLATGSEASIGEVLRDELRVIRTHLDMDIAFVSEFLQGRRYFRYVDSTAEKPVIAVGDSDPLDESYCQYVVDGRLPRLIHDAALIPLARAMPVTTTLPVGAHISVPIHFSDGRVYGTFCCFKSVPDPSLLERDLALVQIFAEFTGKQLERQLAANRAQAEMIERVRSVIETQNVTIVYQPIYHFGIERIVGFESLARFSA